MRLKATLQSLKKSLLLPHRIFWQILMMRDIKEILLTLPGWEVGKPLAPLDSHWDRQLDELIKYHRENGYGIYAKILHLLGEMRKSLRLIPLILSVLRFEKITNFKEIRLLIIPKALSQVIRLITFCFTVTGERAKAQQFTQF